MQKSLKVFLSSLGAEVEKNVKLLNNGGCCVYAAIVGQELSAMGVDVVGVVANWEHFNLDKVRKGKRRGLAFYNKRRVYFNHVALHVEKHFVDSTGVHREAEDVFGVDVMAEGHFTVEELKTLARGKDWNSAFDRKQIPTIRKIVKKRFAEYKKAIDNKKSVV